MLSMVCMLALVVCFILPMTLLLGELHADHRRRVEKIRRGEW